MILLDMISYQAEAINRINGDEYIIEIMNH